MNHYYLLTDLSILQAANQIFNFCYGKLLHWFQHNQSNLINCIPLLILAVMFVTLHGLITEYHECLLHLITNSYSIFTTNYRIH
jgi:thiamine transporter ThiT